MMTTLFRCILIILVLIYLLIIIGLMKKGKMSLKYSLVWFLAGVVLLVCAIFPEAVLFFSKALGVYSEVNAIFFVGVCFLLLIILSLTSIASGQTERIRRLTESQALLERRVRDLEEKLSKEEAS